MHTILFAAIAVTVIGSVCALMLSVASKIMAVEIDERVQRLIDCLPGANCGACGFSGCAGYAEALVDEDEDVGGNLCTLGGATIAAAIGAVLGVEVGEVERKTAIVYCLGDCEVSQKKMDYQGIPSCEAAKELYGGEGACTYGCLGYGDCQAVCPKGAVCIENGVARINSNLCVGCGICAKACPNHLISMIGGHVPLVVLCVNKEKGAVVRKKCAKGCIACGLCIRECQTGAIVVEDYLAKIDYDNCVACGLCAEVCVTHCIQPINNLLDIERMVT